MESYLVDIAGGDYNNGDRVTIRSKAFPHNLIDINCLTDPIIDLNKSDQPYHIELHRANSKNILTYS